MTAPQDNALISLEKYRRSIKQVQDTSLPMPELPEPEGQKTRSEEWHRFQRRVSDAIDQFEQQWNERIDTSEKPKEIKIRLSISSFIKYAKASRTSLYKEHPDLLVKVDMMFKRIESRLADKVRRNRQTKTGLRAALIEAEREAKFQRAEVVSTQLTDLIERLGPYARRDKYEILRENRKLREEIEGVRDQLAKLQDMNKSLMRRLGSASAPERY